MFHKSESPRCFTVPAVIPGRDPSLGNSSIKENKFVLRENINNAMLSKELCELMSLCNHDSFNYLLAPANNLY